MEPDEPLWNAYVTVLADDGRVVGGGVYAHCGDLERPVLLTCAHVVNLAASRDEFETAPPAGVEVQLTFPAASQERVRARVRRWWPAGALSDPSTPPIRGRDGRWAADLAELEPVSALPEALTAVPLATARLGDELWAWRGNGDPRTVVRLRANAMAGEWVVLENPPTGFAVQPGYSGGPLWDRRNGAVVGLVVSAHERVAYRDMTTAVPARQSYAIRGEVLRGLLLGAEEDRHRLDPRVGVLLGAQSEAATAFPYASVGLHRDDLTRVYVRQQLATGDEVKGRSATAAEAAEAAHERPPRTVEDFLARFRHVMVIGPPGTGKSTLTLQLAAALVRVPGRRRGEVTDLVPVRVSAREVARRPERELSAAVSAAARAAVLARSHVDIGDDICVASHGEPAWLLIIDGLDEVEDAVTRTELSERLRQFMSTDTSYRLLLTTRPLPPRESAQWQARADLGLCEIEPFERGQRHDFVRRWFRAKPELANTFLGQITKARLEEAVSVPLLATVAAIVFEEQSRQPLPPTAFALYQHFVSHLYESRLQQLTADLHSRLAGWAEAEQVRDRLITGRIDLLEHCAATWLRGAQILPAALDWLRAAGSEPYPEPTDWPAVVASVLTSTGLVIHDGAELTFAHRSFAEHLAAARAARRLPAQFDPEHPAWWHTLEHALTQDRPQAQQTVLHRALLSDTGGLLDWLLAGDSRARELAARLIFEGVPSTPMHNEALSETLRYWASRAQRSTAWADRLVRVVNTVRIAPTPLPGLLVDLLDAGHHSLAVRDAAIRALLRSGNATSQAIHALIAIMDERPLTGRQRVHAAEMLMDLGPQARDAARAGLARISRERKWVRSFDREHAEKLIAEIDGRASASTVAAATAQDGHDDPGAWTFSTLVPAQRPLPPRPSPGAWDNDDLHEVEELAGAVHMPWADPVSTHTPAVMTHRGGVSARYVLPSDVRLAVNLPEEGQLGVETIAAAVYEALCSNVFMTERFYDAIARWLCAHPQAYTPVGIKGTFDVRQIIASDTPGRVHALAAALIHGPSTTARYGYELLAGRILTADEPHAPLLLLQIAGSHAPRPLDPAVADAAIAAVCVGLLRNEPQLIAVYVRTAQAMGAHLFAARLTGAFAAPEAIVAALLSLGHEHLPDAVGFLTEQAHRPSHSWSQWCDAVRLLRGLPQARVPVMRLLQGTIEALHLPKDILILCQVLLDYGAVDLATSHLLELAQDACARLGERRAALDLIPHREDRRREAEQAHAILADLVFDAASAERIALAPTLRRIDPRGHKAAADLVFSALDDPLLDTRARRAALKQLAEMGPVTRSRLASSLEMLYAGPADPHDARLAALRDVAQRGPELHRSAQAIYERLTNQQTGVDRVVMAAELHAWGWISEARSSRLLTRIARSSDEAPHVRASAAHALIRQGPAALHTAGDVLSHLAKARRLPSAPTLQMARDLAAAGGLRAARSVLSELACDASSLDSHRYKAATVLLMVDLACGPDTIHVLGHMADDPTLSEQTRQWAGFALDCARGGIRPSGGRLPASWLRS